MRLRCGGGETDHYLGLYGKELRIENKFSDDCLLTIQYGDEDFIQLRFGFYYLGHDDKWPMTLPDGHHRLD